MNDEIQKKIFSQNLNYYILESGKTQKEIAAQIGVSPQTFNTWCQGIAIPRMGKVQMLADYFHINKSDLIEKHSGEIPKAETPLDPDIRRIQRAREKMNEQERTKMMKILEASFDDYFGDDFIDEDSD